MDPYVQYLIVWNIVYHDCGLTEIEGRDNAF